MNGNSTWQLNFGGDAGDIFELFRGNDVHLEEVVDNRMVIDDEYPDYITTHINVENLDKLLKYINEAITAKISFYISVSIEVGNIKAYASIDLKKNYPATTANGFLDKKSQDADVLSAYNLLGKFLGIGNE